MCTCNAYQHNIFIFSVYYLSFFFVYENNIYYFRVVFTSGNKLYFVARVVSDICILPVRMHSSCAMTWIFGGNP